MQKNYKSIYGQMAYSTISGLQLLFIPNVLLQNFSIAPTQDNWIRVLGMLALSLGFYYYNIARYGNDKIVWGTILGRLAFCGGMVMLVFLKVLPLPALFFAGLETALALWSWKELKS
jgi:hypothetical protein